MAQFRIIDIVSMDYNYLFIHVSVNLMFQLAKANRMLMTIYTAGVVN